MKMWKLGWIGITLAASMPSPAFGLEPGDGFQVELYELRPLKALSRHLTHASLAAALRSPVIPSSLDAPNVFVLHRAQGALNSSATHGNKLGEVI